MQKNSFTYPLKFVILAKKVPFARTDIGDDNSSSFVISTDPQGDLVDGR